LNTCYAQVGKTAKKTIVFPAADKFSWIITVALDTYKGDIGTYPPEGSTLDALVTNAGVRGWAGPYILNCGTGDRLPKDAWGNDFKYSLTNGVPLVISAGPDGKFGTADDLSN